MNCSRIFPSLGSEHSATAFRIQYGYLKTLPDNYTGPRHIVTVRQLPPVERGEDWFEWEERPGPGPAQDADRLSNEQIVRVCYMERNVLHVG
jgi:hypothetical protein